MLMLIIVKYACSDMFSHMYVFFSLAGHKTILTKEP